MIVIHNYLLQYGFVKTIRIFLVNYGKVYIQSFK